MDNNIIEKQKRHRFKFKKDQYKCSSIEDLKEAAKHLTNFNGNTISNFLKQQIELKKFVEDIFNSNQKKYCTLNKTFIALVKDIEFGHCKLCNKELNYDQTWAKADYCSNRCKLSIQENPFSRETVKKKIKQTNLEKYGVINPMFCDAIKEKLKITNLQKYGLENSFQREDIKEQIKQTNLEKYGVEHLYQSEEIKQKFKNSRKITAFENFQNICLNLGYTLLCDFEHYIGTNNIYQVQCKKCGNIFNTRYDDGKLISRCFVCEPRKFPPIRSKKEIEVYDYVSSIYKGKVISNDRTVIGPQEIDIFLPDLKLGFEFDGTYWHSLKSDNYHKHKDELGLKSGVKIYHIDEVDWDNKQQEVKNFIFSLIF